MRLPVRCAFGLVAIAGCHYPTPNDLIIADYQSRNQSGSQCAPNVRDRSDLGDEVFEASGCSPGDLIYSCAGQNNMGRHHGSPHASACVPLIPDHPSP
jgi:hypothetical protein